MSFFCPTALTILGKYTHINRGRFFMWVLVGSGAMYTQLLAARELRLPFASTVHDYVRAHCCQNAPGERQLKIRKAVLNSAAASSCWLPCVRCSRALAARCLLSRPATADCCGVVRVRGVRRARQAPQPGCWAAGCGGCETANKGPTRDASHVSGHGQIRNKSRPRPADTRAGCRISYITDH